jgi:hypothetical protein
MAPGFANGPNSGGIGGISILRRNRGQNIKLHRRSVRILGGEFEGSYRTGDAGEKLCLYAGFSEATPGEDGECPGSRGTELGAVWNSIETGTRFIRRSGQIEAVAIPHDDEVGEHIYARLRIIGEAPGSGQQAGSREVDLIVDVGPGSRKAECYEEEAESHKCANVNMLLNLNFNWSLTMPEAGNQRRGIERSSGRLEDLVTIAGLAVRSNEQTDPVPTVPARGRGVLSFSRRRFANIARKRRLSLNRGSCRISGAIAVSPFQISLISPLVVGDVTAAASPRFRTRPRGFPRLLRYR